VQRGRGWAVQQWLLGVESLAAGKACAQVVSVCCTSWLRAAGGAVRVCLRLFHQTQGFGWHFCTALTVCTWACYPYCPRGWVSGLLCICPPLDSCAVSPPPALLSLLCPGFEACVARFYGQTPRTLRNTKPPCRCCTRLCLAAASSAFVLGMCLWGSLSFP
jgi:hypothetical protein